MTQENKKGTVEKLLMALENTKITVQENKMISLPRIYVRSFPHGDETA
jgi:hypothetical protein